MPRSAAKILSCAPMEACVVARDLSGFGQIGIRFEEELPESWDVLPLDQAAEYLALPEAIEIEVVIIAVNADDEAELPLFGEVIRTARDYGHKVLVIADSVGPISLHVLLAQGADGFVPYPIPIGALSAAIKRLTAPEPFSPRYDRRQGDLRRNGAVLSVHGLAGGVGTSTFAVNLAWELATIDPKNPPKVALLDLDLQFGSTSTHLGLPPSTRVLDLLMHTETMDRGAFMAAMVSYHDRISVMTAPPDVAPFGLLRPEDVSRLLAMARSSFDYVIVDMPKPVQRWTKTVVDTADASYALLELDVRSSRSPSRIMRALDLDEHTMGQMQLVLNRTPRFAGRRVCHLSKNLRVPLDIRIPDGGWVVRSSAEMHRPLALYSRYNAVRRYIARLAREFHEERHIQSGEDVHELMAATA